MKRLFMNLLKRARDNRGKEDSSYLPDRVRAGNLGVMSAPVNSEYTVFRHTIHYS